MDTYTLEYIQEGAIFILHEHLACMVSFPILCVHLCLRVAQLRVLCSSCPSV